MIQLDTAEDIVITIVEWHDKVLEAIEFMRNDGSTATIHEAYDNILDLIEYLPINNNFSLNDEVMEQINSVLKTKYVTTPIIQLIS